MNEEKTKELLKVYFEDKYYKRRLNKNQEYFNNIGFDIEFFNEYIKKELSQLEKKVLKEHIENKKSLKKIANELNYSYSYTRRIYLESTEKLKIIARLHLYSVSS